LVQTYQLPSPQHNDGYRGKFVRNIPLIAGGDMDTIVQAE